MSRLGDYLTRVAIRRRVPGEWDCCTFAANWIVELGFPDPMAAFRGTYSTDEQASLLMEAAGGMVPLIAPTMDALFERTSEPSEGDVGVARLFNEEAGCIFSGKRWAFVLNRGMGLQQLPPESLLAIWKVSPWPE